LQSGAVADECVEHFPQRLGVAVQAGGRCLDIAGGIEVPPGERVSGVAGELADEGAPCAPSAVAERVPCVDLAQVIGEPPGESLPIQATQEVFFAQLAEDDGRSSLARATEVLHATNAFNEPGSGERLRLPQWPRAGGTSG
jgi:hypothetical protein